MASDEPVPEGIDLVGSPFGLIESDPSAFTSIMQKLGVFGVQSNEILTLDSLEANFRPFGFIFCFKWSEDSYHSEDYFNDESDTAVPWFANQLSDDSCATLALLNILLNCEDIDIGPTLTSFKEHTIDMDPVMRGLCIASSNTLHHVHNSFARPIDIRGSISKVAATTLHPPKTSTKSKKTSGTKKKTTIEPSPDSYHFLSYVPHEGRVWEMDGLKRAPLECCEFEGSWLDAVLPALRGRMESLSRSGEIRFNLLAIVPSVYQSKVDELELGKRKITFLERRLLQEFGDSWKTLVPEDLQRIKEETISKGLHSRVGVGFGARSNDVAMAILQMNAELLVSNWKEPVQRLVSLQLEVEEEIHLGIRNEAEHIKRTHDYDPFIQQYVAKLYNAGFLQELLDIDGSGRPRQHGKGKKR